MGVGIDICEVKRLENQEKLAQKILSADELKIYESKSNKAEFFAGRFAAKEAYIKATKGLIKDLNLNEISVINEENGAPRMFVRGKEYEVSISHDGGFAIAIVMIKDE